MTPPFLRRGPPERIREAAAYTLGGPQGPRRPPAFVRLVVVTIFVLPGLTATAEEARAQGFLPAMGGAAAGLVSGGLVSVGIVSAQARRGAHLDSVRDALGWESAPVVLGTVGGAVLGSTAQDRLAETAGGALVGWLAGGGTGYLLGRRAWDPPDGPWAGLAIGGAVGLVAGAVAGFFLAGDDGGDRGGAEGPASAFRGDRVTLALAFRF